MRAFIFTTLCLTAYAADTHTRTPSATPTLSHTLTHTKSDSITQSLTTTATATATATYFPESQMAHSTFTISKAMSTLTKSELHTQIATDINVMADSFRISLAAGSATDTTKVDIFALGGPTAPGPLANDPMYFPVDNTAFYTRVGYLKAKDQFTADGKYPITGDISKELALYGYKCGTCERQYDRTTTSPVCTDVFKQLPNMPFASDPADSPWNTVLAAVGAQAAAAKTAAEKAAAEQAALTRTPTPPPTVTPTSTPPIPDPPQCEMLIGAILCHRAYPFCHDGKPLKLCRSMCDALLEYCPGSQLDQLAAVTPDTAFNLTTSCADPDNYEQNLNSETTPCMALWDLPFLFLSGAKAGEGFCETKTVVPDTNGPVESQVSATTLSATALPTRSQAIIEVSAGVTSVDLPSATRNLLVEDFANMLGGIELANLTVGLTASEGSTDTQFKIHVFIRGAKSGTSYLTATNIKEMLTAGVATAPWKGRWGESTVAMAARSSTLDCTSCSAKQVSNVHPACQSAFSELYHEPAFAQSDTVTAAVGAAFSLVASPQAQEIGPTCLAYLQVTGCSFFYPPCHAGKPLRMCVNACHNILKFCEPAKLALVQGSAEAGALGAFLNCSDTASFVQAGSTEECLDSYDNTWVVEAKCTDSPSGGVVPTAVGGKLKAAVAAPTSVTLCGADCSGTGDFTCPINAAAKFTMKKTQCVDFVAGAVCTKLSTCGAGDSVAGTSVDAYYSYTGSSAAGTLSFFSDAECTTASGTALTVSETTCTSGLKMIAGGISIAKIAMSFDGVLASGEKDAVQAAFLAKLPALAALFVEFLWTDTAARRAGSSALTVEIGAPLNVEADGTTTVVGAALANQLAAEAETAVNSDAAFQASLKSAAGNKTPSTASVTLATVDESSDGSGSIIIIIIIVVVVVIIAAVAAGAVFFLMSKKKGGKGKKVKPSSAYDDEEDGYGGA